MKRNKGFLTIGITGGAGSGKSTIVEYLKMLAPTEFLHCDEIAHELMEPGGASYQALLHEFGEGILEEEEAKNIGNGKASAEERSLGARRIAKGKLAEIAMATPESRKRLNALTHPLVRTETEKRLTALQESGFQGVAVIEAALLLEAGFSDLCDEVWYVYALLPDRIRRMRENRGYSEEKIRNILEGQLSDEEFRARTDFTLENPDAADGMLAKETKRRIKERLETMADL